MKKARAILSVITATLLVVSTISFSLEKHFCLGQLVDISLLSDASCAAKNSAATHCDDAELDSLNCCDNQVSVVEGQDLETTVSQKSVDLKKAKQSAISAAAVWVKDLLFSIVNKQVSSFEQPPNSSLYPSTETHIALETYLL